VLLTQDAVHPGADAGAGPDIGQASDRASGHATEPAAPQPNEPAAAAQDA
jgi:hypothetical protein